MIVMVMVVTVVVEVTVYKGCNSDDYGYQEV